MLCLNLVLLACQDTSAQQDVSKPSSKQGDIGATTDTHPAHHPIIKPVEGSVTRALVVETLAPLNVPSGDAPVDITPMIAEAAQRVTTEPGDLPRLKLEIDGERFDLPLRHTHVKAALSGDVARVEIEQTYENPFAEPIETVYVFPLPENSAVDGMRMGIGERVVEAEIKKRQDARQIYDDAKQQGRTAALLEQERPNIFTQSVANIAPHSEIKFVIRYVQDLTYDAGAYEFVFPMVVGPRFIPPGQDTGQSSGDGWAKDTAEVGDASRITPPIVGAGVRTGHDISLELTADAGVPIHAVSVPTHNVALEEKPDGTIALMLAEERSIPNRDFVLRYKVAGERPTASVLTYREGDVGYVTLTLQPPQLDIDALVGQREFIFVVDVSGSMSGMPLNLSKDAMTQALRKLRPIDTFNIIRFESSNARLFDAPRPASMTNIREGMEFVTDMHAGGGTLLGNAVQEALTPGRETDRHRYVVFMTDAQIGNDAEILSLTERLLKAYDQRDQKARVFAFGMGASPNRHLIENIARIGKGAAVYTQTREDPTRALNRLFALVDSPIIEDITIDWGDLAINDVYPQQLPDFFAARPLTPHARYTEAGRGKIKIHGHVDGQRIVVPVEVSLPTHAPAHAALATLWARAKINTLEQDLWSGHNQRSVDGITQLGLKHGIVTAYTSFVAVDRSTKTGTSKPMTIIQPLATPDGVEGKGMSTAGTGYGQGGLGLPGTGRGGGRIGGLSTKKSGRAARGKTSRTTKRKAKYKPKLKLAAPKAGRFCRASDIRKSVVRRANAFRACYERRLQANPGLQGKIVVEWTIGLDGKISGFNIKSATLQDSGVTACLERVIRRLRFPKPDGGVCVVQYPFIFKPSD